MPLRCHFVVGGGFLQPSSIVLEPHLHHSLLEQDVLRDLLQLVAVRVAVVDEALLEELDLSLRVGRAVPLGLLWG